VQLAGLFPGNHGFYYRKSCSNSRIFVAVFESVRQHIGEFVNSAAKEVP
jgi:hypothetical protein